MLNEFDYYHRGCRIRIARGEAGWVAVIAWIQSGTVIGEVSERTVKKTLAEAMARVDLVRGNGR